MQFVSHNKLFPNHTEKIKPLKTQQNRKCCRFGLTEPVHGRSS